MKRWRPRLLTWWHQRQLDALYFTLHRQALWGIHAECLSALDGLIRPRLKAHYPSEVLKRTKALFHAPSIDHLTSDIFRMTETIMHEGYVDERLSYVTQEMRHLHAYLTHRDGYALPVDRAYAIFHAQALEAAQVIDGLAQDEEEDTDSRYYLRRYQGLLNEIFTVYRLFAFLADLHFPTTESGDATAP